MNIGEKIKAARKAAGMTQKQLGERAGIAEPTIRRYELGKLNPKYETVKKIANALDTPTEYFISDSQDEEEKPSHFPLSTGSLIRLERKNAGLTQEELANRLGIAAVGISQWESGRRLPKYETLQRIADALNVPIESISGYAKPEFHLSPEEERLLSAFNQLNISGKAKALERIEEIAELKRYQKNG